MAAKHCDGPAAAGLVGAIVFVVLGVGPAAITSCASDPAPAAAVIDQKVTQLPAVDAATQRLIRGPVLRVKPKEDRMICWVPDWTPDRDYWVSRAKVLQGSMGHHLVAMKSSEPLPAGKTFDCATVSDMITLRPLVLPDNSTKAEFNILPAGHAVKLPKGTFVVLQSHYINTSADKEIEFQDAAILTLSDQPPATEVNYLIVNDSKINVPPGETWTHTTKCQVKEDVNILATLGHMHEWGTSIDVRVVPPSTDPAKPASPFQLYQIGQWKAEYRDAAPVSLYKDPANPLAIQAGSTIELTCTWKNTEAKAIKYPNEMCVSVSYYYPAAGKGLILCDP